MASEITCRPLESMADINRIPPLEQTIWRMAPDGLLSPDILRALTHNGGVIIGAEADGRLIGFALGFPARRDDEWWLWSHAAGVDPAYQGRGIGFELKQRQRLWAMEHGYDTIRWTFDPMQRGNANFNLHRLGAVAQTYHTDHYGEMTDSINAGLRSDRFEVVWHLRDSRVVALAAGETPPPRTADYRSEAFLLRAEEDRVVRLPVNADFQWHFAEIPYDLRALKTTQTEQALRWQLAFREAMLDALSRGYTVVDFVIEQNRCWYVLTRDDSHQNHG